MVDVVLEFMPGRGGGGGQGGSEDFSCVTIKYT